MKQNNWEKIPFESIIKTIAQNQGRDNYDPHKISRKENKNFFSIRWYDKYDYEVVVLTKDGRKMLKKTIQPFLAEKIKFVDIDHDEHGTIDAIKIITKNRIYTYSPRGKDGETIFINRWFELYRYAKRYNFLSRKPVELSNGFKYINHIQEDNDYVFVFQDMFYPKNDWDEDSFLYLYINSKGKIIKCPQGENSLLIKLS